MMDWRLLFVLCALVLAALWLVDHGPALARRLRRGAWLFFDWLAGPRNVRMDHRRIVGANRRAERS